MGTLHLFVGVGPNQSKGLLPYHQEENDVYRSGDDPGDGVGDVQVLRRAVHLEDGKDPHDSQAAGADQRDDHGAYRVAKATQTAHHGVHDAAQGISPGDIAQADDTLLDYVLLAGGIDAHQRMAEQIGQVAQYHAGDDDEGLAVDQAFVYPLALASAVVLAGEGEVGLVEGVHGLVDKVFDVGGGGGAGHHRGAEGVDGGLDEHVGQGEDDALEAGRQANFHDLAQNVPVNVHFTQVQAQGAILVAEAHQDKSGRDVLRDGGGHSYTGHAHAHQDNRHQVQYYIYHAGNDQVEQRTLGIALGTKNSCAEVIGHGGGHTQEVDAQIEGGQIDYVLRGGHPDQQLVGHDGTKHRQHCAADQSHEDGGMYCLAHHIVALAAQISGYYYVGAYRQAHKQGDQQVDEGGGGAHGGQRLFAREPTDHDDVCGVKQQLENTGCHKRNGEL